MRFSVCITTVRAGVLGHAIRSIAGQTLTDWELIVVGQGPDEAALRAATEEAAPGDPRVRYLHLEAKGRSRALNAGMRASGGEIIANTDDDCEADPHWLEELDARLRAEPGTGAVGGALVAPSGPWHAWSFCPAVTPPEVLYDPVVSGRQAPAGWDWIGANIAIRREVQERVGAFDECLGAGTPFPAAEDLDYKLRMEALGIRVRTTPAAIVHHSCGRRTGLRARMAHARAYCLGNGGFAGKLTLQGDPRGGEHLRRERQRLREVRRHPLRYPFRWRNLRTFEGAYRRCLEEYTLDSSGIRLVPRHATAPRSDAPRIPQAVERGDGR